MALTADEQKALDHLAQEKAREEYGRRLQASLKPVSQVPAQQTRKKWAPLTTTGKIKGQAE